MERETPLIMSTPPSQQHQGEPRGEAGHAGDDADGARSHDPPTFSTNLGYVLACVVMLGLAQLLSWLGAGFVDPWTDPLSILQFTCFLAFAMQVAGWVPSVILQTEKGYDVTGSLTYLVTGSYSLAAGYHAAVTTRGQKLDPHAFTATCMLFVWCLRLGFYLFSRALKYGDSRFVVIKRTPLLFLAVWFMQGLWVMLGALPVFIVNANHEYHEFAWTDVVGGVLYAVGLSLEVAADRQKATWRELPEARGRWIDVGLWRYSRHPNLFGEWLLQFGIFVFCAGSFSGSQWVAVVSPVFEFVLLRYVSGVPTLERKADERFGGVAEYEEFKRTTSVCVPLPKLPRDAAWAAWLV